MVAAQDGEGEKYPEEMIRAFALLKASRAQFQAHPERIEFEGSPSVRYAEFMKVRVGTLCHI